MLEAMRPGVVNDNKGNPGDAISFSPSASLPIFLQMHVVAETNTVVGREAVIRTSMGDIRAKLFPDECPKVLQPIRVHARESDLR